MIVRLLFRFLRRVAQVQGLILDSQVGKGEAAAATRPLRGRWRWLEGERMEAQGAANVGATLDPADVPSLQGTFGVALSDLRPSGVALIAGERMDVVSNGEYITAGDTLEVTLDDGYRRVVRRAAQGNHTQT